MVVLAAATWTSSIAQQLPLAPSVPVSNVQVVFSGVGREAGVILEKLPKNPVSDAERSAVVITSSDLDLHIIPDEAREELHATLTIRNSGSTPMARLALQLSSTLRWQSVSSNVDGATRSLSFTQSPVATDTDHTGFAEEVIVELPMPLAAGASITLTTLSGGKIEQSAARLGGLNTANDHIAETDWDAIRSTTDAGSTALRGFGNVLWYPVSAPLAVLGDGNKLFAEVAQQRLQNVTAMVHLRLTVEYVGDPPVAAIFNGVAQPLARLDDGDLQHIDDTQGVATADFPRQAIGFRILSLFLTAQHALVTEDQALAVITPSRDSIEPYAAAAVLVQPLLKEWFGETPLEPLKLLDHPGQPFEDGPFLVAQLSPRAEAKQIAPAFVGPLTHAWFHINGAANVWLNQGFAEFLGLLWTEQTQGRPAALARLKEAQTLVALNERDLAAPATGLRDSAAGLGEPLTAAASDVFVRVKSGLVLWQLRELLGEETFKQAVQGFRRSVALNPQGNSDDHAFQRALEKVSGKELGWFFDDWVYRDQGLPDLTITQVNPRLLPARPGKNSGYLVAVEVRNDGDAVADVPVTVRSGELKSTERLRIYGHSSGSVRVLFESAPETVEVNDGSVAELRTSVHRVQVVVP